MFTPHPATPAAPARKSAVCMCMHGEQCSSSAPGHALHLIQARLAAATPREWIDGIVEAADAEDGTILMRALDGSAALVWSATDLASTAVEGSPVALHARWNVLAVDGARVNVARLSA